MVPSKRILGFCEVDMLMGKTLKAMNGWRDEEREFIGNAPWIYILPCNYMRKVGQVGS